MEELLLIVHYYSLSSWILMAVNICSAMELQHITMKPKLLHLFQVVIYKHLLFLQQWKIGSYSFYACTNLVKVIFMKDDNYFSSLCNKLYIAILLSMQ